MPEGKFVKVQCVHKSVPRIIRDCPLRYGPITLYGTLDGGYGYELWGTPLGTNADKPNYAIQRSSGNTHWLWSPKGLSTSTNGLRLAQKGGEDWEIIGVAEAGCNPYTLRLFNGPQSLADNNPFPPANQSTRYDTARVGTWDNGQAFIGAEAAWLIAGGRNDADVFRCRQRNLRDKVVLVPELADLDLQAAVAPMLAAE